MIDIHSHILPNVDDGATSKTMSNEMFTRAKNVGITTIVCTPHVYSPENQARNMKVLPVARKLAHKQGMRLHAGCEFNYRALLKSKVNNLDDFCLAGTKCILLELSNDRLIAGWEPLLCEIVEQGYLPIIAHPERYRYIQNDLAIAEAMCSYGCELQLDAGGLMAPIFSSEHKTACQILASGMASYVASDAHRPNHYMIFEKAYKTFASEWPKENRLFTLICKRRVKKNSI